MMLISIHAPREGGDGDYYDYKYDEDIFQSTPPARGATTQAAYHSLIVIISIHAPREGGDPKYSILTFRFSTFQSTPPARGATL